MKKIALLCIILFVSIKTYSQNSLITISGGYAFAKIEDVDTKATGWRINGLYEFNVPDDKVAHGISIGYISVAATENYSGGSITSTINSFPIYYAPKYMFGKEKFKGFVKGAIGGQFASLEREGLVTLSDNDFGLYAGAGAGIMIFITEKIFVNGEYEIAWASNSLYSDGWINSAMGGIGIRF